MDESNRKTLQRNNHKLPNLSALMRQRRLSRPVIYVLAFLLIQVGLENLYEIVSDENLFHLHTSITAGILDNILPAFIIFWLLYKYVKNLFLTIVALTWLGIEILDGIARIFLMYAAYFAPTDFGFYLNENFLIPIYWVYVLIPLLWLMAIRKNFTEGKSDKYTKSVGAK